MISRKTENLLRQKKGKQRGFLLITSYLVISVLATFSLAYFARGNVFFNLVERTQNRMTAFNMAESGLDDAITQLAADPAYTGSSGYVAMNSGTFVRGGYDVVVCAEQGNANNAAACSNLTLSTDPSVRIIQVMGMSPSNQTSDRNYESRIVMSAVQIGQPPGLFGNALFANGNIGLERILVDSYDSREGSYGGDNINSNGHMLTNKATAGA